MKKRLLILSVIALMSFQTSNTVITKAAQCKPNSLRVSVDNFAPQGTMKFDEFWTPENEGFLSSEEKEQVNSFRTKVENRQYLSVEEKCLLKDYKNKVIKSKLGEEKYTELEKLINKREGETPLTLEERARLYQLEKEITGNN